MTIASTNIRTAIEELLEGTIGKTRTVTANTVVSGHQPWHGQILVHPRIDIKVEEMRQHEASPVSALASYRLATVRVTIDMFHELKAPCVESQRNTVRENAMLHADTCLQALRYPNNLRATNAGALTTIVSGCFIEGSWTTIREDLDAAPPRIWSRITGTIICRVTQAVS